ncbi:MAG: hypothetical protein IPF68_15225 [Bacteroidales bacterium]|nr:hypothetical protein [Bacteroidales bacterium]
MNYQENIHHDAGRTPGPGASPELLARLYTLSLKVDDILFAFNGKQPKASREENPPAPVCINERMETSFMRFMETSAPTATHRRSYDIVMDEFTPIHAQLKQISQVDLPAIEAEMEKAGVPYTPGRLPQWE